MQIHPQLKQKPSPFFESAPKRSLSYNDLKRKRLIRSQKSKTKLHPERSEKMIIRTEKKKPLQHFAMAGYSAPNTAQDIRKIQRSINELKDVFDQIKEKAKTKKYIISKPFYTDRANNQEKRKISFLEKSSIGNGKVSVFYESVEMAGKEKELIREIISKKKSQRRLLKFDEIRAEVKRSKSKSKSKLNLNEEETAPHSKIINHSSSREVMQHPHSRKNIRVNKFQSVPQRKVFKSDYQKTSSNNTEVLINNYQTSSLTNRQTNQLSEKSQYRSRRKLKIEDFKTERREIEVVKEGQKQSDARGKFHRRLRKTNSEIVIKTTEALQYNKSKYTSRLQSKSTLNVKQFSERSQQQVNKSLLVRPGKNEAQAQQQLKKRQTKQQKVSLDNYGSSQNDNQINLLRDLELSAINISEIEIRKESSFTEIENDISLVNAIQAQELQLEMKRSKPKTIQNPSTENKQLFKKAKKETPLKPTSFKQQQNAENNQNLSNLLDFISLPTQELKVKINRCSTKVVKKKNEMEKFKKIFPANFFNK